MSPLWLWLACVPTGADSGIAVGNPGQIKLSLAEATDLSQASVAWPDATLEAVHCDGSADTLSSGVDPFEVPEFEVAGGRLCGFRLYSPEHSAFEVTLLNGADEVSLRLDLGVLEISNPNGFSVDGQDLVFELGQDGWTSAVELNPTAKGALIDDTSPLHDTLVERVDGLASAFETDQGSPVEQDDPTPLAVGSDRSDELPDVSSGDPSTGDPSSGGGSGCGGHGQSALWLWIPPLWFSRRGWRRGR